MLLEILGYYFSYTFYYAVTCTVITCYKKTDNFSYFKLNTYFFYSSSYISGVTISKLYHLYF